MRLTFLPLAALILPMAACSSSPHTIRQEGARLLYEQNDAEKTIEVLDAHGDVDDIQTRLLRAEAAFEVGDLATAEAIYKELLDEDLKPGPRQFVLFNLGVTLRQAGATQEAYAVFQEHNQIRPGSEEVQAQLGATALEQGSISHARMHLARLAPAERSKVERELGGDFFDGTGK